MEEQSKAVQVFNFQDYGLRAKMIDGEPWFVASDACQMLDIKNVSDAVGKLDEDEKNTIALTDGNRGNPNTLFVSLPGLQKLIFTSRKPEANKITRWVTHDVLPSIYRTGAYMAPGAQLPLQRVTIQTLVRIETRFNQVIELLQVGSEFRIDSRQVAPGIGIDHSELLEALRTYQTQLEHFGSLPFETAVRKREIGATHETYVMLNREQVLFAITLSRNTPQVVQWKMALIDALRELDERLQGSQRKLLSPVSAQHIKEQQLSSFLHERCIEDAMATTPARSLYEAYCVWCKQNNVVPLSHTLFGLGVSRTFRKMRKAKGRFYSGVQLDEQEEL